MRRDRGASAVEYGAVLLLVAAIVAAVAAVGLPGKVSGYVKQSMCQIFDGQNCASTVNRNYADGNNPGTQGTSAPPSAGQPRPADNLQLAAYNTPEPTPSPSGDEPAEGNSLGSQVSRLPTGGNYPFVPKKGQRLDKPKSITRKGGRFVDADGNEWQWDPVKGEWDVQHKIPGNSSKTSHTNVGEDGEITHGEDNFPRKPRPKGGRQDSGGDNGGDSKGGDTAKSVAVGAGAVGAGALIWWGAKVLSPACGPFVVVCAIAF